MNTKGNIHEKIVELCNESFLHGSGCVRTNFKFTKYSIDEYISIAGAKGFSAEEIEKSAIEHSGMKPDKVRYRVEAFFALGG